MLQKLKDFVIRFDIYIIVALAAVLRFIKLPDAFYGTNTELFRDLLVVYEMIVEKKIVLLGPSTSLGGFYFGAIYYYLLAPFVWLFRYEPEGAIFLSGLCSVLSVIAIYKLLKTWFNSKLAGSIGALLLCVSVFDIQNAYYVSNPNLMPLFWLVYFLLLTRLKQGKIAWPWGLALGATFGILTQLHATALLLAPLILFGLLWLRKPKASAAYWLTAAVAFIATYAPYIVYEVNNRFANVRRIFELGESGFGLIPRLGAIGAIGKFFYSSLFFYNGYFYFADINRMALYVMVGLWLIFLIILWTRISQKKIEQTAFLENHDSKVLLWLWAILGIAMFAFYQNGLPEFYFLALWPLPIIFLVLLALWLKSFSVKFFHFFISLFIISQAVQLVYFYPIVTRPELDSHNFLEVFNATSSDAGKKSYNVIADIEFVNAFVYYSDLKGFDKKVNGFNPENLYIMHEKEWVVSYPLQHYKKTELIFTNDYYVVERFERIE